MLKLDTFLKKWFSVKERQVTEKHLYKCLNSLAISKMQNKMTFRCYLIPVRIAKINSTRDSSCWHGYGARGLFSIAGESENFYSYYGNQYVSSSERWDFTSRVSYPILWHVVNKHSILQQRPWLYPIHCYSAHNIQKLEPNYMFPNRKIYKIYKENVVHLHYGILQSRW